MAFTGPGSRTPGTGNPDFWIKSGNDVYYDPVGSGNVGIGTASPNYQLDVNGDVNVAAGSNFRINGTALPQYSDTHFKIGSFTRAMTADSGSVAYTGVGFRPSAVIFLATIGETEASVGFSNVSGEASLWLNVNAAGGWVSGGFPIMINTAPYTYQVGYLASLDSDGFTIAWTKSGSPTGSMTVNYLALR